MGRAREAGNHVEVVLPRGLRRSRNAGGDTIQIAFSYRGIECRECLRLDPDSKKDVKIAENLRAEIKRKIELGTFVYTDYFPRSPRAVKFGHVIGRKAMKELLEATLLGYQKAEALGKLSPSTIEGYRKIITGDLLPFFGSYALRDVTPVLVRKWIKTMDCTTKTARNRISLLRSVLDDALEDGLIDENPLTRIALKKALARSDTTESKFKVDPFDEAEREAILVAAASRHPQVKNLFQFAFWTGLRTSELMDVRADGPGMGRHQLDKRHRAGPARGGRKEGQGHDQDAGRHAGCISASGRARGAGGAEGAYAARQRSGVPQPAHRPAVGDRQADPGSPLGLYLEGGWREIPQPVSMPSHLRQYAAVARRE